MTEERNISTADLVSAGEPENREATQKDEIPNSMRGDADSSTADDAPLVSKDEATDLRARWDSIQTKFVDEPRAAVQEADSLVAEAVKRLAEVFANERSQLEQQWDRGDEVDTEDLRVAMQRYRSFFNRLLAV